MRVRNFTMLIWTQNLKYFKMGAEKTENREIRIPMANLRLRGGRKSSQNDFSGGSNIFEHSRGLASGIF